MTTIKLKNGSGAPTAGDLAQGEPALDLTNKRLYTEDSGGTVIEVGVNPTSVTTGAITATGIDVTGSVVSDGITSDGVAKVTVTSAGATAEALTVYNTSNSNNSQVDVYFGSNDYDTAGRGLRIEAGRDSGADGIATFYSVDQAEHSDYEAIKILTDGGVTLSHLGSNKLATSSSGIDVTGTVTADGLTVDGSGSNIRYDVASSNPHTNPTLHLENQNTTDGNVAGLMLSADNANGAAGSAYIYAQSETANQKGNLVFGREDGTDTPVTSMKLSSNGDISFYEDTGTTAKLFWDASAESLGIGTSSPASLLHIETGANGNIIQANGASNAWDFILKGTNDQDTGSVLYEMGMYRDDGAANPNTVLKFGRGLGTQNGFFAIDQNGTEAMRIDSSGNLLVGTTDNTIETSSSEEGVNIYPNKISVSRDAGTAANFNRITSDGDIVKFRKDGTVVGSIDSWDQSGTSRVGFVNNDSNGLGIYRSNSTSVKIVPLKSGALDDGTAVDLGNSTARFKDLYLSGGVYLGGTDSANLLDDYEHGSWTPTADFATTSPTSGATTGTGRYTKVGNVVTVWGTISNFNVTGAGGDLNITSLPFLARVAANLQRYNGVIRFTNCDFSIFTDPIQVNSQVLDNSSVVTAVITRNDLGSDSVGASALTDGTSDVNFTLTYETAT